MQRFIRSILPTFLLSASVGQIYAFTNFSSEIAAYMGASQSAVQFAFSLGIFFLGMGAAFFGSIVEKNIRIATNIGTILFLTGLLITAPAIHAKSIGLLYLGYGVFLGLGTGIIYISPVKTMMLWFPTHKAIAAAIPIISFGLGSTITTLIYKGFSILGFSYQGLYGICNVASGGAGICRIFLALAIIYSILMSIGIELLRKPNNQNISNAGQSKDDVSFSYKKLIGDSFFRRSWLFMLLNISAGLCLIPLARQMMYGEEVGYSDWLITSIVGLCGIFNGGGRFMFAWWSDHLQNRMNIMLIILFISAAVMGMSLIPMLIGVSLLVINACYGAGFSVIPAILSDHYGMSNLSKIHGAVLSAWGVAGIIGNQTALVVQKYFGGYYAVIGMLIFIYLFNAFNVVNLKKIIKK